LSAADSFTYATTAPAFQDVTSTYWAYGAIETLAAKDIVSGFPEGTFRPSALVNRAQFVKMLVLTLGLKVEAGSTPFTDVPQTAWYAPYVATAMQAGVVAGMTPTRFSPDEPLTREQMAVLLARALHLTQTGTLHFSDVGQIAAWALPSVEAVVAGGYMSGFPNGTFQPMGVSTRAQVAAVLAACLADSAQP
jgi:dextranase